MPKAYKLLQAIRDGADEQIAAYPWRLAKNILLFADGTGNVGGLLPDESRTNVYKLYRATRNGPDTEIDPSGLRWQSFCAGQVPGSCSIPNEADGAIVYRQACALGCEGIVSKRLGSRYVPGRARCWVKVKNPEAPAVRRLEEEDWKW